MRDALKRTLVIGNSGAGKSTFAANLAALLEISAVDLDVLHWEDHGYGRKRNEDAAMALAREAAASERWIIEGVYGWLAKAVVPRATALVWLDMPWDVCREGLRVRGPRRGATPADMAELFAWAEAYWTRATSSSFAGHEWLYEAFAAPKWRLRARDEAASWLATLRAPC